jgi:hypothetical protein
MIDTRELADLEFFSRLESVELRARSVVEGFLHGLHRSPYIGFSVEFASHHEYVPGDDPRHINWKLYARQHRLYVKEFDGDTNLNLYIHFRPGSGSVASLWRSWPSPTAPFTPSSPRNRLPGRRRRSTRPRRSARSSTRCWVSVKSFQAQRARSRSR